MRSCDHKSYAPSWNGLAILALGLLLVPSALDAQSAPTAALGPFTRAAVAPRGVETPKARSGAAVGVVNLNAATLEQLTRLPGIGPARARAVLELRARLKRFRRVEELMRVRGIGRKTFRRLLPMLRLSGETTLLERPRRCATEAAHGAPPS